MGGNGFIQHPEVAGMRDDEYGELIADPYAFLIEKVVPRQYKNLDPANPFLMTKTMNMAIAAKAKDSADLAAVTRPLAEEYGYYSAPAGSNGFTAAPYDYLADQLRSFSGISMDIRRRRSEISDACEALYPLMYQVGIPRFP